MSSAKTRARVGGGDTHVPDKVLSVFEPHIETIGKGEIIAQPGIAVAIATRRGNCLAKRKVAATRELIDTGTDKRYVRRSPAGTFKESDDVGKVLTVDRRKKATTKVNSGQGDKGDR